MKKCFIIGLLILVLVANFPVIGAPPLKLVGAQYNPPEHVFHRTLLKFSELVKKYYSKPIEIDIHHSGDIGNEKDFFEYMMQGMAVDFAIVAPSWMATWVNSCSFMDTPFLFDNINQWDKALKSRVFSSLEKKVSDIGVKIIGYCGGGTRNMIFKKPLTNIKELRGNLMRVMGSPIQSRVFGAVGLQTSPIAYLETYNAIKTGVADGCEGEAAVLPAQKFYEVAPYIMLTRHNFTIRPLCFGEKKFQSLPSGLQKAIIKAGEEASQWGRHTESSEDSAILKKLSKEGKIKIVEFTENKELRKRTRPVIKKIANEFGLSDILDNISKIK
jgi:TRAP-type C4-dicarboxylate transport system substrate-binding protein